MNLMKSWIDSCMVNDNVWLVLVFHGVDGAGWEAIPGDTLNLYFDYIMTNKEDLWVATFQDVTKYIVYSALPGNRLRINRSGANF